MIRGLMTDEEWVIFVPFLITCLVAWRAPTHEPSEHAGRHTLDLLDRSAMARLAGGVRQMELGVDAHSGAGASLASGTFCFRGWPTAAAHWTCCR